MTPFVSRVEGAGFMLKDAQKSNFHHPRRAPHGVFAAAVVERRRRDVRVPHEVLHGYKVHVLVDQPRRERSSEIMRRHGIDARGIAILFQNPGEGRGVQRAIHPQPPPDRVVPEKIAGHLGSYVQPLGHRPLHVGREEGLSFLVSFPDQTDRSSEHVHLVQLKTADFRTPKTAAEKEGENGPVPNFLRVVTRGG